MLKFYDCLTAPSPRRVRILVAEKGIKLQTVQVDLAKGEHLSDSFQAINPQQTVPVLELEDGTRLLDSNSISLYLDEVFPGPNLTGTNPKERAVIAMWQRDMDINGLLAVAECFRNSSKGFRNRALTGAVDYEQIPELAERGRRRVRKFFTDLNCRLADSEYLAGGASPLPISQRLSPSNSLAQLKSTCRMMPSTSNAGAMQWLPVRVRGPN